MIEPAHPLAPLVGPAARRGRSPRAPTAWALALLALVAATAPLGCSAVLDWDPDGLACDTSVRGDQTYFCLANYSCLTTETRCVRDHSLKGSAACTQSRQCAKGQVCPFDLLEAGGVPGQDGVQRCAQACSGAADPFYQPTSCPQGSICTPFLDSSALNPNKGLVAACVPQRSCTPGSACSTDTVTAGTCVDIGQGQTACLTSCEITWGASGGAYQQSCDSAHYCQPLGAAGAQAFVCLYNAVDSATNPLASVNGQTVQPQGASCSPVEAPCATGDVCAPTGVCAQYCQITGNDISKCPTNQTCCPFRTFATTQASGFCSSACP